MVDSPKQNFRIQLWITLLSVGLFLTKIIAYYSTHSLAILSDALESIVNVIAGFIGLFSLYIAAKPSDQEHPYGHGKAEFVSAAIEGALIMAAGIMIIYETVINFLEHSPLQKLDKGLWLVSATALLNYAAGWFCIKMGKKNKSLALQASGKHLQIDTYSTLGIVAGLLLILLTDLLWLDKLIALGMSILVIYNGYKIVRASLAGIMDEADMELLKQFITLLNTQRRPNLIDLHNLRVIKYGPLLHIDCHITVPWFLNVHQAHLEIDELAKLIKQEFGNSIELFVHTDGCLPISCSICTLTNCDKRQQPMKRKLEWSLENILSNQKHQL